jgi:hypothetical protein
MMLSITLFLFSSLLLGAMLVFRVWEIRAGRFDKKELASRELSISPAHIEHWNSRFFDAVRQFAHFLMVLLVRATIELLFIVRREAKRLSTRLDQFFLSGSHAERGPVSFYLQNLSGYRDAEKTPALKGRE